MGNKKEWQAPELSTENIEDTESKIPTLGENTIQGT